MTIDNTTGYFDSLVTKLINFNLHNRRSNSTQRSVYCAVAWAKMFCTVVVDIGRRTGKTLYVLTNAMPEADLIVVRDVKAYLWSMPTVVREQANELTIISYDDLGNKAKSLHMYYENIYLDEPIKHQFFDKIYEISTNPDTTYILLGGDINGWGQI